MACPNWGLRRTPTTTGHQVGVGYAQRVIENGLRVSAAHGFIRPALNRPGLDVRTNAHVVKVLLMGVARSVWRT